MLILMTKCWFWWQNVDLDDKMLILMTKWLSWWQNDSHVIPMAKSFQWLKHPSGQVILMTKSLKHFNMFPEFSWKFLIILENSWIFLKISQYSWNFLNILEYSWIFLNISEYSWIFLKILEYSWIFMHLCICMAVMLIQQNDFRPSSL